MSDPAAELGSRLANGTLGNESWAREALARHAGRTCSLTVGPLASRLQITAEGSLKPADLAAGELPDLELVVSPLDVAALLSDPSRSWTRSVMATGDSALASTLQNLAQTLPWFVERALATALGPIVGQRIADAGRALLLIPDYVSERLAESVVGYASGEANLLAPGAEARTFAEQVGSLAERVDSLDQHVDRLSARIAALGPKSVD